MLAGLVSYVFFVNNAEAEAGGAASGATSGAATAGGAASGATGIAVCGSERTWQRSTYVCGSRKPYILSVANFLILKCCTA